MTHIKCYHCGRDWDTKCKVWVNCLCGFQIDVPRAAQTYAVSVRATLQPNVVATSAPEGQKPAEEKGKTRYIADDPDQWKNKEPKAGYKW